MDSPSAALLALPHHDGSSRYVGTAAPEPGETVTLRIRVPHAAGATRVVLRSTPDAEPTFTEATVEATDEVEAWWRVDVRVHNPVTNYRFLLDGGPTGHRWVNGSGVHVRDVPDGHDFRIAAYAPPPAWAADAVVYQIFPDRFASSGTHRELPDWAIPAGWDDPVITAVGAGQAQLYGGDLDGVRARLDHVAALGADTVYLTPIFPAGSNHRYDASTFDHVDPLLGGDRALAALSAEIHARGMRLIGDLTTNHAGDTHDWFVAAQQDPSAPESSFFYWREHPHDYVSWFDVPTLPKFDHSSPELRRRLYDGRDSVVARWLRPPYALDGWRIDVANMTGRYGASDMNRDVAAAIRRTMAASREDLLLIGEHCHDYTRDVDGDGWHGTMNYAGFTRPVWSWLVDPGYAGTYPGLPVAVPTYDGTATVQTMRDYAGLVPWRSWAHSFTLLGSHDSARFRTVVGSAARVEVGVGLLLTMPGVPMIFAGDEVGIRGASADEARQPMPWDPARWDAATYATYRRLVALRRSSEALRRGGLRWVHIGRDCLVYLRETPGERMLVAASRRAHEPVSVDAGLLGSTYAEPVYDAAPLVERAGMLVLPGDGPALHVWRLE